ncbi:hypothetical protein K469DRAFT_683270 [Zopfia rhizophila CBS 207.26]|uniref:Uncharacterized protein n=1 Tax=Zopfia rhizophila CBS 207.26 TaxID=1314779 RepID=A0A6A6ED35_9PEZI|nr:hypothetical protein K469DRAFT_683270 [Zopfia rhizophila CBS 207.26]
MSARSFLHITEDGREEDLMFVMVTMGRNDTTLSKVEVLERGHELEDGQHQIVEFLVSHGDYFKLVEEQRVILINRKPHLSRFESHILHHLDNLHVTHVFENAHIENKAEVMERFRKGFLMPPDSEAEASNIEVSVSEVSNGYMPIVLEMVEVSSYFLTYYMG